MSKLIKITTNEEGKQLVSARELHEFLESGQDFTTWIKNRIEKYEFVEDEDFTLHKFMVGKVWKHNVEGSRHNEENLGGRPTLDFAISLDFAK